MISISIVSHGHAEYVDNLLLRLAEFYAEIDFEVILTKNIPEQNTIDFSNLPFPIILIQNPCAKGFGSNHNAAFKCCHGKWFCVMNPDVVLNDNPFPLLLRELMVADAAVIAPATLAPTGEIEDSVRHFPNLRSLFSKFSGFSDGCYRFGIKDPTFSPDWVAGMFMLFHSVDFERINGFDEKFFLYYEDVDICARLWKAGRPVMACPKVTIVHDARRTSRKNLRYMRWHVASMIRYFWKHWGRLPHVGRDQR
jgi:N-acetylglucosaminyl-diphospho-decaprenol L-rhamnosyltransferase